MWKLCLLFEFRTHIFKSAPSVRTLFNKLPKPKQFFYTENQLIQFSIKHDPVYASSLSDLKFSDTFLLNEIDNKTEEIHW